MLVHIMEKQSKYYKRNFKLKKFFLLRQARLILEFWKKIIKKKKFSNVEIFNMGLGDIPMESFINQTKESSSSTINKLNINSKYLYRKLKLLKIKKEEDFIQKLPIKITTLDNLINEKNIENIDLLKIDTEGNDFDVLVSAKNLIENNKIKLIKIELNNNEKNFLDICEFLFKNKYELIGMLNHTYVDNKLIIFDCYFKVNKL